MFSVLRMALTLLDWQPADADCMISIEYDIGIFSSCKEFPFFVK